MKSFFGESSPLIIEAHTEIFSSLLGDFALRLAAMVVATQTRVKDMFYNATVKICESTVLILYVVIATLCGDLDQGLDCRCLCKSEEVSVE